jgi:radical SAM protein with 4Fe4S-binding SPASM domain
VDLFSQAQACLPSDCETIELRDGLLMVSPGHAVFCPLAAAEWKAVQKVLSGHSTLAILSESLLQKLSTHGFFGPPREQEKDPPSVQLQLTNDCNLACSYCCTNSGKPRAEEVGFDEFCAVIERLEEAFGEPVRVALLGGEPLLVQWATDLGHRVLRYGHELTLFTNGLLLCDDAIATRVAELVHAGAELRVSLGGPNQPICDELSRGERFERVLHGLEQLARHDARATLDLMLMPQNASAVARDWRRLQQLLPAGTEVALGVLYRSGREEGAHLFTSAATLEAALCDVSFGAGVRVAASELKSTTHRREGCGCALGNHLHVRSDGALFTCFKMEERVGHLRKTDFVEAVRRHRETPHPAVALELCRDCVLRTLCGGGCRAENFLYTGDADTPACGPWRVQVMAELLAEEQTAVVDWPVHHLCEEARRRGIDAPTTLTPVRRSSHLVDPLSTK